MWMPIVGAAVSLPLHIFLWTLELAAAELLIASVPLVCVYLGACFWQARRTQQISSTVRPE